MHFTMRVLVPFAVALTLLSCAQTPEGPLLNGYTCCNLHFEENWISDANWSALPMLPAGTPVRVLVYEKHRAIVDIAGRRMTLGLDYGRQQGVQGWINRLIVPLDPRPRIEQWPAPVREAVQNGIVAVGMTKEQVIASLGYPPAHETPSLDAPNWRYWYGKLDTYLVQWDESGRVREIAADAETRSAAMRRKASWPAKSEGQVTPLSGERRAAMRSASIAEGVSLPERPDVRTAQSVFAVRGGGISTAVSVGVVLVQLAAGQARNAVDAEALNKRLQEEQIDLSRIVRTEFAAALTESKAFAEIVADKGNARFQIKVDTYGLADLSAGKDNARFPQLFVRLAAALSTPDGEVVWRQSAGHASHEVLADPTRMGEGFRKIARVAANELVNTLPSFAANALPPPAPVAKDPVLHARVAGHASPLSAGPLPPVDTTWVYRLVDRMYRDRSNEITVRVVRANEIEVEEVISAGAKSTAQRVVSARQPLIFEHRLDANRALIELAPYILAGHNDTGVPHGLEASGYPQGLMGPWLASLTEAGWERITVPAGTFRALRVEINGRRTADRGIGSITEVGRFSIVAWYSPEVKRLLRLEHKAWSANYANRAQVAHDVFELVSYRPPS